jgi:RNA-directed DNA polymerase
MNRPAELCRVQVSELQRRLANKATSAPTHRFTKLYDLLTWEPLLAWAFDTLMTNAGSRTAGIDGMAKRYAQRHRETILGELRARLKAGTYQHQPVRRVFIPKANGKRRPLGIPTLTDRLVQLMAKAILEPIFESDFRPESHGFRPGRSCHTALAHLHQLTAPRQKKMYWVIEGDITGCFDHIQHQTLMRLLRRRIQDHKLLGVIWQMLRAGVMEGGLFTKTAEGTPQGGIISPLLANVYLHELDLWFHQHYTGLNYNEKNRRRQRKEGNAFYVRYADDFVVAWNGTKAGAEHLKTALATFLRDHLGLELSAEKTHITHVTKGYDFLGFTLRRSRNHRGTSDLLTRPSTRAVMKFKAKVKAMTDHHSPHVAVRDKIAALNYLTRGWATYYRHTAASRTFRYIGHYVFKRMEIWLRNKTRQGVRAIYRRYYQRGPHGNLMWCDGEHTLFMPSTIKITRLRYAHRPNPYLADPPERPLALPETPFAGRGWDGTQRRGATWTEAREQALERDGRTCRLCGAHGKVEVHHIRPWRPGRPHELSNLITLCGTCHRQVRDLWSEVNRQLARMTP